MAPALPGLLVSRVELYITVFSGEVFECLIGGVTGTCEDDGGHRTLGQTVLEDVE